MPNSEQPLLQAIQSVTKRPIPDDAMPLTIDCDGIQVRGFRGESLAAVLFAGDRRVLGRSLKYHRPRGIFCMDGHCSGCLMRVDGVPNLRTCMIACSKNHHVESQNALPSAKHDLLGLVDFFFAKGMNHHTLMTSNRALSAVTQKMVRRLSGLGQLPDRVPAPVKEIEQQDLDVLVVGGGPAGLNAAIAAAKMGAKTMLVDEGLRLGGSLRYQPRFGRAAVNSLVRKAQELGVDLQEQTSALAHIPEENALTLVHSPTNLMCLRATSTVHATGSYAQNLVFENNERPNVLALRAAGLLLMEHGIVPGDVVCLAGDTQEAQDMTTLLRQAGVLVEQIPPAALLGCEGDDGAITARIRDRPAFSCAVIVVCAPPAPASELARQHGAKVQFDGEGFAVVRSDEGEVAPGVFACGDVCGYRGPEEAACDGSDVGMSAAAYALGQVRDTVRHE